MKILNQGFDHVEFTVESIAKHAKIYQRMGFESVGKFQDAQTGLRSELYQQGFIRILLTENDGSPLAQKQEVVRFQKAHGDGISVLAIEVDDATAAFRESVGKGARPAMEPERFESPYGTVVRSEIWTPGDLRYAFIERKRPSADFNSPALFLKNFKIDRLESPSPMNLRVIDHLTNNVSIGEMQKWVKFYLEIFDFTIIRHFDIRTGRTGLISDAVQSRDGKITVPINEATEPESQVQEFVNRFNGPGVQHLALLTTDIITSLKGLKKNEFKFLTVPHSYYEVVPTRVPGVTEDLTVLEDLGILLDSEGPGYLMQIFSEEIVGPFFFEFIQRKGNKGFGEGNFRALFEAIERDQVKRGTLKA